MSHGIGNVSVARTVIHRWPDRDLQAKMKNHIVRIVMEIYSRRDVMHAPNQSQVSNVLEIFIRILWFL